MTSARVGITASPRDHPADFLLACTLGPKAVSPLSALGQTRTSAGDLTTSALPPKTDIARQIGFIVRSPTTRRSILLIRSERSTSAALMAAVVCRNVLTFDPNDTIPPSTMAIDPMAAT